MSCVVNAISGKRNNTCLPKSSWSWMSCTYSSVLPDPVTPCSKVTLFSFMEVLSPANASDCAAVSSLKFESVPLLR